MQPVCLIVNMKWLDLHPEAWAKLGVSGPIGESSKAELISDGPYSEVLELDDELEAIPLYAWILPAKKISEKYNKLFEKHGIPLLN